MLEHGAIWGLATILGPLLLLAAMVYGVVMYRRRGDASKQQTEEGTRALYREASRREWQQGAAEAPVDSPPLAPDSGSRNRSSVEGSSTQR